LRRCPVAEGEEPDLLHGLIQQWHVACVPAGQFWLYFWL
jgi:hypothetical protein